LREEQHDEGETMKHGFLLICACEMNALDDTMRIRLAG
jgi:hypothetical protein